MTPFTVWLIAVAIGVSTLLNFLLLINLVVSYRELRRVGHNRPLLVIRKYILSLPFEFIYKYKKAVSDASELNEFVGRKAWVSWDIRWLSAGKTFGEVLEIKSLPDGYLIKLSLSNPIEVGTYIVKDVYFKPFYKSADKRLYARSAVSGMLTSAPPIAGFDNEVSSIYSELVLL